MPQDDDLIKSLYRKLNTLKQEEKEISNGSVSSSELTQEECDKMLTILEDRMLDSREKEKKKAVEREKKLKHQSIRDLAIKGIVPVFVLGKWIVERVWEHLH
jgi:hypothetical protein